MGFHNFDYERCVVLHNEPLQIGWVTSDKPLDDLERTSKTWFEFYGEEAKSVRHRLSDGLVAFLERTLVVEEANDHSLFYHVNGLSNPYFWRHGYDGEGTDRFLTLYLANDMATHPDGLVFDQKRTRLLCKCLFLIQVRTA